jgi:hypothetical protein
MRGSEMGGFDVPRIAAIRCNTASHVAVRGHACLRSYRDQFVKRLAFSDWTRMDDAIEGIHAAGLSILRRVPPSPFLTSLGCAV